MKPGESVATPADLLPFDGSQLVARHAPGTGTRHQQDQAARLARVRDDLRSWAERFWLPQRHIDRAAYFTVVSTPLELPFEQVKALAETIFWIYVFDDYLDQRSANRQVLPQVEHDLCRVITALAPDSCGGFSPGRARQHPHPPATSSLVDELALVVASAGVHRRPLELQSRDQFAAAEHEALTAGIRDALGSLLALLDGCWRDLSSRVERGDFRRRLVSRQIARCMASMRREFEWNIRLAGQQELPSFNMYMMTGSVSIGMHAVAAVVASYERDAESAWRTGWAAIDTAGRIIRLANDLATYPRELAEGKLSSLTLIMAQPGRPDADAAANVIRQSLHQLTEFFGYLCRSPVESGILPFYVRHIVAFAVAAYRREEEATPAAQIGEPKREDEMVKEDPTS
jgi:hypothetical protein